MRIAVIGAGVTGLCAALRLAESRVDEIVLLEKEMHPGGLLQSTHKGKYWWDNGLFQFVRTNPLIGLLPELFQSLGAPPGQIWRDGAYHPSSALNEFLGSRSPGSLILSGLDYLGCCIKCRLRLGESNLHGWLCNRMTAGALAHSQLENYVKKAQRRDPRAIAPAFGEHRLRYIHSGTRPGVLLRKFLDRGKAPSTQAGPTLYESKSGVGAISRGLAALCQARGIQILYETKVEQINETGDGWEIAWGGRNGSGLCRASHVISTMPLDELVTARSVKAEERCLRYADELAFADMTVVLLAVNRPMPLKYFTVRSFDPRHPWKRLLGRSLGDGSSTILVENTFDPQAGEPHEDILPIVEDNLCDGLGLFQPHEVLARHAVLVRKAYPIYDIGYDKRVSYITGEMQTPRFRLAGRQGQFMYASTDKAIQSGIAAAESILQTASPCPRQRRDI